MGFIGLRHGPHQLIDVFAFGTLVTVQGHGSPRSEFWFAAKDFMDQHIHQVGIKFIVTNFVVLGNKLNGMDAFMNQEDDNPTWVYVI